MLQVGCKTINGEVLSLFISTEGTLLGMRNTFSSALFQTPTNVSGKAEGCLRAGESCKQGSIVLQTSDVLVDGPSAALWQARVLEHTNSTLPPLPFREACKHCRQHAPPAVAAALCSERGHCAKVSASSCAGEDGHA